MPEEIVVLFGTLIVAATVVTMTWILTRRPKVGEPDPKLSRELADLRDRVGSLEDLRDRLEALEDRQDFTERMLTQKRDRQLPDPGRP